jgi:hypothetical protein
VLLMRANIYGTEGEGFVAVFSIDRYGDLSPLASSVSVGVSAFNGVAISE